MQVEGHSPKWRALGNFSGALQRPEGLQSGAHNYRAKIEIEKTMRLSFHGHRG